MRIARATTLAIAPAASLATSLAFIAGCGQLLGIDDNFTSPDGDTGITNHVGVAGHSSITYHTELDTQTVPEDLSQVTIDAYVVDDAGIHVYPGTSRADGTFEIPDVPARDYYLRLTPKTSKASDPPSIWHLQSHDIDLSHDQMGRPNATLLQALSPVSLTTPTMQRFLSQDNIEIYASVQPNEILPPWSANSPELGVDHLASATFDWSGHPALDENGLWIVHHGFHQEGPDRLAITTANEAAHVGGLHQTNGDPLPVSFAFTPGIQMFTSFGVDAKALRPRRSSAEFVFVDVLATPDGGTGTLAGPALIGMYYQPADHAPVTNHSFSYTDPFPNGWSRTARIMYANVPHQIVTSGNSRIDLGDLISVQQIAKPGGQLTLPGLTTAPPAPSGIKLDGAPITDAVRSPTAPIHLAWDPIPTADHYSVFLFAFTPDGTSQGISVSTTVPEIVVPGDAFPDQHWVSVSVSAVSGAPLEPVLRRIPPQQAIHQHSAALLFVSSTCGNGVVEPGEACDTRGESTTCNFDCTKPRCGDGITNTAAHEECDLGKPDLTCDAQCRAIVCGDGVVAATEQCDDGNTNDGDGCSSDCYVEQLTKCGNHVVDPGEECDDGNTDNLDGCTNQCKKASCGDGLVSSHAGEECDDSNTVDGDGCSFFCHIERCGDGRVIYPEQCDDGNNVDGDGCSQQCKTEP
jgi:cysteine-rich repeat protein